MANQQITSQDGSKYLVINADGSINTSGTITVDAADECQRILTSDDAVTTINYSDATKTVVSNIVTSSAGLGRKVTDTYDNSGATTLVLTRVVANA